MSAVPAPRRRTPDFRDESEAYSSFRRGVRFLEEGHPAQAAMHLSRALMLEPGRTSIREALGRAEFALGRFERAATLFREITDDVPDHAYAHYALARCLRRLGERREARAHLRLARALDPASEVYRQPLEGVD